MAIDFPSSPSVNDTFTVGDVIYKWDGTVWTSTVSGAVDFLPITGGTVTGAVTLTSDLTVDTDTLYVDSTNNKVGVGMTPVAKLDVSGNIRTSTGIIFGTDTAAANHLDDYEEGTWTPVVEGATTAGTYTGTFEGTYTKIGNQVTLRWTANAITQSSAGSGNLLVSGIPFALAGDDCYGVIHPSNINFNDTAMYACCRISSGSPNSIAFRELRDNNSTLSVNIADINSGSSNLGGQITYYTS